MLDQELRLAARRGDVLACEILLTREPAEILKRKDVNGMSALHFAVYNEHFSVVKLLLSRGASVNQTDNFGQSALYGAILLDNVEMARLLLEHGAAVHNRNIEGSTALHQCAVCGTHEIASLLLVYGADPLGEDLHSATAMELSTHDLKMKRMLERWPQSKLMWALRTAQETKRLGVRSALRRFPCDLTRVLFTFV